MFVLLTLKWGVGGCFFSVFKATISSSNTLTFSLNISSHSFSSVAFEGFGVLKNCLGFFFHPFPLTCPGGSGVLNAKVRISF